MVIMRVIRYRYGIYDDNVEVMMRVMIVTATSAFMTVIALVVVMMVTMVMAATSLAIGMVMTMVAVTAMAANT